MVHPWAKYDKKKKSTQGFLRFRVNEILVRMDGRTDGQPENIMPPAPYTGSEA